MTLSWPVAPMLATPGSLPDDGAPWALELKWDGVRVLSRVGATGVRGCGRRGQDVTDRYPELSGLADLLPGHTAVLDGEVVAFDHGVPSFERLQRRMHVDHPGLRLVREVPVRYVIFDLLELDGLSLLDVPYGRRRELLDGLELVAGPIEAPPHLPAADTGHVEQLLRFTRQQRLEGVLAKRLDSPYLPGRRVPFWRKIKNFLVQEVVVGGWQPGKGRRAGGIGSLLLGVHDSSGPGPRPLLFVGHVGTGFTDLALAELHESLAPLRRDTGAFTDEVPREFARGARWVEPRLVGEVAFSAWTRDGRLRAASWRGLRDDKDPAEVVREPGEQDQGDGGRS